VLASAVAAAEADAAIATERLAVEVGLEVRYALMRASLQAQAAGSSAGSMSVSHRARAGAGMRHLGVGLLWLLIAPVPGFDGCFWFGSAQWRRVLPDVVGRRQLRRRRDCLFRVAGGLC
jgi:hypothetical protein